MIKLIIRNFLVYIALCQILSGFYCDNEFRINRSHDVVQFVLSDSSQRV